MHRLALLGVLIAVFSLNASAAAAQLAQTDATAHRQSFITTGDGTRLEVLDYGGDGPPLIFISGLDATGHAFDKFAPRFIGTHHVFAVTRRGIGASDKPPLSDAAYNSRRLGDDVLDVMDALKVERAVLAGWSMGGVELSSIATRYPGRVAGVVYLDAGYAYSFYAPGNLRPGGQNLDIAVNDLRSRVRAARHLPMDQAIKSMDEILSTVLPDIEADVSAWRRRLLERTEAGQPSSTPALTATYGRADAIQQNVERFPPVKAPMLAIYAGPPPSRAGSAPTSVKDYNEVIDRFRTAHPHARVIVLDDAQHDVFDSNPEEVEREMRAFIAGLAP
jgi:non-heme chloroperoxidase